MIKKEYIFYISIGLAGCEQEEKVEIEFEGNETEEEKEKIVKDYYDSWLMNFSDFGWYETEQNESFIRSKTLGEAERIMKIMVKFKRKLKIKYVLWMVINCVFAMFMIWKATNI